MSRRTALRSPMALLLLFLAAIVSTQAQTAASVSVAEGAPVVLECAVAVAAAAAWTRDGGPLPRALAPAGERAAPDGSVLARLAAPRAAPALAGEYRCGPAPHQRTRLVVLPAPLTAEAGEAAAGAGRAGGAGDAELVLYNVGYGIELVCDLPNPTKLDIVWKKNATAVEAWWDVRGRYRLEDGGARLVLPPKTHEDDFGNYSCAVGGAERAWRVQGNPHSKLPANTNVVEGQKLKLQCRVVGKPYPAVTWLYENSTGGNLTDALTAFAPRAELATSDQGVEGGALLVSAAQRTDAGRLVCRVNHNATFNGATTLRVKDMYAALWPFLGICAEVFVLCAVILLYERRRAKPELEDSDTDHHDAKKS